MITNHIIKNNTLYLYLDYSYEFGTINFKNNVNKIKNDIKKYIIDKKILFTGSTIAIVVGGFIIGNIILNNNDRQEIIDNNISYGYDMYSNKKGIIDKNNNEINNVENNKINDINNSLGSDIKQYFSYENNEALSIENVNEESKYQDIKKETSNIENKNNSIQSNIESSDEETKIEKSNVEEIDNNIYVNVYRSNGQVLNLELEEYLIGCVGAEMPAAFNIESLKAQTVIARTYALKSIKNNKILTDIESTQSYKDENELRNLWGNSFNTYYNKVKDAVNSTKGEYLSYNNDYIEAVYHSTSNGITESSINVWGNYYSYLTNVESNYDSDSPTFMQSKFYSYEELSSKLNIYIDSNTELNILSRTSGNRIEYIRVGDLTLKGVEFRNRIGLRSADFDINIQENGINFITRGYGHGVGMSQYGANGMAKIGYNYVDILMHYYPGTVLKNTY